MRDDLDAPVIELQAEGDVTRILNSGGVRQADTDTFRLWEDVTAAVLDASEPVVRR